MLKLKLKGFTLIECIVALALLGVASLSLVQIYATVCGVNRSNHEVNTSLMYQMQFVENYIGVTDAVEADSQVIIYANGTYTDKADVYGVGDIKKGITITKKKSDGTLDTTSTYTFPTDIHVLLTRDFKAEDTDGNKVADTDDSGKLVGNYDLRYKYIVGNDNQ